MWSSLSFISTSMTSTTMPHPMYRLFTWICFYLCSIGAFVPSQNRPFSTTIHHHQRQESCLFALSPDNLLPSADILKLIANTDRGADASRTLQDAVNLWIFNKADHYANHSTTIALNDPNLYGNYDVAFVGTSRAQAQEGNPAGGRFRGKLGRLLYQTTGVYQVHIHRFVIVIVIAIVMICPSLYFLSFALLFRTF